MDMVVSDYDPTDIVDWVDALSLDTDPDRRGFIAPSFARKCFRGISDSDWQKLLKHGLLDVLLDMLCRDDMGGRKWETLADDEYFEKDLVPRIMDLLMIFVNALAYLAEGAGSVTGPREDISDPRFCRTEPSFVQPAIETVATKYPVFVQLLLEEESTLRNYLNTTSPRLYPDSIGYRDQQDVCDMEWTFGDVLFECHDNLDNLLCAFSDDTDVGDLLLRCSCESAKIMFLVWMRSTDYDIADAGFLALTDTLNQSDSYYGETPHIAFFQQIKDNKFGDTTIETVCRRISNDLRRSPGPFMFGSLMECVISFHEQGWIPSRSSVERSIFWRSMAAFRARVCSEEDEEDRVFDWSGDNHWHGTEVGCFVSSVICHLWDESGARPILPELWLHEVVALVSRVICPTFSDNSNNVAVNIYTLALLALSRMLLYYSRHPSSSDSAHRAARFPPTLAARKYSLSQWKIARRTMRSEFFHLHAQKKQLWTAWNELGSKLELGVAAAVSVADPDRLEFGPLKRCAYAECMCSVYKSSHPMKSCKRCYLVAYCNKSCQEKDWKTHRSSCFRVY